jgi:hypothetical protein
MIINRSVLLLAAFLCLSSGAGIVSSARAQSAKRVSGCELLKHPRKYNGKMVIVEGKDTWGFERGDLTFGCPGRVWIHVSVTELDRNKFGFLTEKSTLDAMSQLPPGEHPGDNLTTRKMRFAPVVVEGLFRCRYDFPTCKGALPDDGSIVVKSMQFNAPISEVPPTAQASVPATDTLLHESGHVDPPKQQ